MRRSTFILLILIAQTGIADARMPARLSDKKLGACSYCGLEIVADTAEEDNVAWVESHERKSAFRCLLCALAMASSSRGDLTVIAPSDVKGKPVRIVRHAGNWSASPETARFVFEEGSHSDCQVRYRALVSPDGAAAYARQHSRVVRSCKPITLTQLLAKVK